jgi:DNA-binding transcriptional regulator YiaG
MAGLLMPEQIEKLRESTGYNQADFGKMLGVGELTVRRWESGVQFQFRAHDLLMRAINELPNFTDHVKRWQSS